MTETSISVQWYDGITGSWIEYREARDAEDIPDAIRELEDNARPYPAPRVRIVTTTTVEINQ